MLSLSNWPEGAKVILRAERPHPGAQLTFTDADGMRITAIITDIPERLIGGQTAPLPAVMSLRGRANWWHVSRSAVATS